MRGGLTAGAVGVGLLLSACGAEEELAKCLNANEQTILLKQMALTGEAKKNLDWCLSINAGFFTQEYCRSLYLNANGLIRTCMKGAGYTFIDPDYRLANGKDPYKKGVCEWPQYALANCYRPTWLATIQMWLEPAPSKQ
jgi:hypothetical protein